MKKLIFILFGLGLIVLYSNCSKCKNEDPRARIVNEGTQKVSVQVKTSGGNTENINNIQANSSSDYVSYAEGNVEFTISIGNNTPVVKIVAMEQCWEYDIKIDAANNVASVPTDRNK